MRPVLEDAARLQEARDGRFRVVADPRAESEPVRAADGRDRVQLDAPEPADRRGDVVRPSTPETGRVALVRHDVAADLCNARRSPCRDSTTGGPRMFRVRRGRAARGRGTRQQALDLDECARESVRVRPGHSAEELTDLPAEAAPDGLECSTAERRSAPARAGAGLPPPVHARPVRPRSRSATSWDTAAPETAARRARSAAAIGPSEIARRARSCETVSGGRCAASSRWIQRVARGAVATSASATSYPGFGGIGLSKVNR